MFQLKFVEIHSANCISDKNCRFKMQKQDCSHKILNTLKFVFLCQKSGNKQKQNFEKIEALNESNFIVVHGAKFLFTVYQITKNNYFVVKIVCSLSYMLKLKYTRYLFKCLHS